MALSEWERALRIDPTGSYTLQAPTPGNNFTSIVKTASDIGITADANSCWVELEIRRKGDPIDGHIIPDANETYDLGGPDKKFRDLYLSGNTLYMGGQPLSISNGQLVLNGNPVTGSLDVYKASQTAPPNTLSSQFAFSVPGSTTGAYLSPTQNRALVEDGTSIKVYRLQSGTWSQEGSDIPFFSSIQYYGNGQRRWSKDGSSFIVSSAYHTDIIKIYYWTGMDWQQRGLDLSFTQIRAIDINQNGTKFTMIDGSGASRILRTYVWDGTSWQEATQISNASSCNMSADGNRLAVRNSPTNIGDPITIRVYDWSGTHWINQTLISNDILGVGEFSGDGNALFVADSIHNMQVYFWDGLSWQLTSFMADLTSTSNSSYALSEDGTKLMLISSYNSGSNSKWSIWEYNGSTWSQSSIYRNDLTGNASADYDVNIVLLNLNSTEDFYTYDVSSPINEYLNKYLNTFGQMEGDTIDIWFDNSLAYMPLETCYIYTDELNWIGCRVIQNTTATNNILKVKILEKLGDISGYEYSITNSPLHLSNYTKETVSINNRLQEIPWKLDSSANSETNNVSSLVPGSFWNINFNMTDSNNSNLYAILSNASENISYSMLDSRNNGEFIKILDPFSTYKYRTGSLRGILTEQNGSDIIIQPDPDVSQDIFSFYVIAVINTDPIWPNGLNDLPSIYNIDSNGIYSQGIKHLILDKITVNLSTLNTQGNSFKILSDIANLPYEIELNQALAIYILTTENATSGLRAEYVNLNYDLIKYDSPIIDAMPITPTPTPWPTATPTPTPTPTATATPTPPTPTPTATLIPDPATIVIDDISHQFTNIQQMDAIFSWTLSDDLHCTNIKIEQWNTHFQQWIPINQNGFHCSTTSITAGSSIWCGATVSFRAVQSNPEGYADVISEVYVKTFPACPPTPTETPVPGPTATPVPNPTPTPI